MPVCVIFKVQHIPTSLDPSRGKVGRCVKGGSTGFKVRCDRRQHVRRRFRSSSHFALHCQPDSLHTPQWWPRVIIRGISLRPPSRLQRLQSERRAHSSRQQSPKPLRYPPFQSPCSYLRPKSRLSRPLERDQCHQQTTPPPTAAMLQHGAIHLQQSPFPGSP